MVKTLTKRFLDGLRSESQQRVFDAHTRGLALRVGARRKVWYFSYSQDGETRWLRLGEYPALSLASARKQVNEQRSLLDKGIDPVAADVERRKPPAEPEPVPLAFTFADFVPAFIAFQKGRRKKTWEDDQAAIDRYLLPAWKTLPLRNISRKHVHEVLEAAAGKGLTIGVNRLQALISRIFTVALDRELVDANPAHRMIKRFAEIARDRVLDDAELRHLWAGLDAQPGAASDALRLRLLLGQRGDETTGMLWKEVELEPAIWSLPGGRTKNARPHAVPLPATALEILVRRHSAAAEDAVHVFPGLTTMSDEHKALNVIHGGSYVWKDLRRTVSTRLAELGFDDVVIDRVLNHVRGDVTSRHYDKYRYAAEIRVALTAWDRELQRILANEPKSKTNVLPMRSR